MGQSGGCGQGLGNGNGVAANLAYTKFLFVTARTDDVAHGARLRTAGGNIARGFFNDFDIDDSRETQAQPFETIQFAVPIWKGTRPYQQIVFQYSLHIQESFDAVLKHRTFLAKNDGSDPRLPFIRQLIPDIGDTGDIIVFNKAFEAGRLNEIATNFPNFKFQISNIVSRIKDLMLVFQNRDYYVPEMKGSYSIKQVLPALVTGFSYDNMAIGDGGSASHAYMSLISETDPEKIRTTRENLLEYCKLDTRAMVEILKVLMLFLNSDD